MIRARSPYHPDEIAEREQFFRQGADRAMGVGRRLVAAGAAASAGPGYAKVYLVDLAHGMGMSLADVANLLMVWHQAGWVELVRADMAGGFDAAKLADSAIESNGSTYHLMVVPTAKENPAPPHAHRQRGRAPVRLRKRWFWGGAVRGARDDDDDLFWIWDCDDDTLLAAQLESRDIPGHVAILSRDTYPGAAGWRISYLQDEIPEWHTTFRTCKDAMRELGHKRWRLRDVRWRELRENPAWLNKAIADNVSTLQTVPAEWMPKIPSAKLNQKKRVEIDFTTLGCGSYGCALETRDPGVVMKVTTDVSEVAFVEWASTLGWPEGITQYFGTATLDGRFTLSQKIKAAKATVLWREAARHVGKIDSEAELDVDRELGGTSDRYRALPLIAGLYDSGSALIDMVDPTTGSFPAELHAAPKDAVVRAWSVVNRLGAPRSTDRLWINTLTARIADRDHREQFVALLSAYKRCAMELADHTISGRAIGEAVIFYLQHGRVLADLHFGNFGIVDRDDNVAWVITDPGNILVVEGLD